MKTMLTIAMIMFGGMGIASAQQLTSIQASRFTVASVEQIAINFETLNEHDWCYFDIKRQINYTGGYTTIHTMYAVGNTAQAQGYLYTDFGPFSPTDVYCYRIEVWDDIDLNAVCEYYITSITACDNSIGIPEQENNPFIIFPNPGNGKLTIVKAGTIQSVQVVNTLGQMIDFEIMYDVQQEKYTVDISNQPDGVYFISIRTENNTYTQKIWKNRDE